jgi:hypothetical protein
MQTIRTTTKACGTQFLFHLSHDCSEIADIKVDGGSITELGSRLEVLQNWEVTWKCYSIGKYAGSVTE